MIKTLFIAAIISSAAISVPPVQAAKKQADHAEQLEGEKQKKAAKPATQKADLAAAPTVNKAADESEFTPVFNGKDLSAWDGDPTAWEFKDGTISSKGRKGSRNWLVWRDGELEDFELRLQYKYTSGNSGVQVRSEEIEKWMIRGYQIEIATPKQMGLWHHSISGEKYRSRLAEAGEKGHVAKDGTKTKTTFATAEDV
jgi:hypothetical protein